ncbi:homoserine dehydrogenase [Marinithermofilum abyssi]|uniref:Homoserine dehydrogenase n=1 Tax=Marinithermofilum abyssi TaxID=1571185 RepID=A0A8J2YCT4_9BACL|nr:homoserine dehydrogenase [Marinithermofilum abyssi]GGE18730.1 homoserine dehydrogenase [Marinithermofilum abyssi]
MVEPVRVGLMGLGTVGTGVVRLVEGHQEDLRNQTGKEIVIEKILVQDIHKERNVPVDQGKLTDRADEILQDPRIDVVVEVMGGIEPTRELLRQAVASGKHVVTANKDLMALHGAELLSAAAEKNCDLYYEASVAGGIPILRALVEGFSSDRITKMIGIVNGTTNYILTEMSRNGADFEEVLAQAQALGYAEANPASDVEGLDAGRKMAILATLGFHAQVSLEDVTVEGITQVTLEDIRFAEQLGYVMKLVGLAQRDNGEIEVSVEPALLPKHHPLASVDGVYNAVYVHGEAVGETMFYGPGAGELPTATAVVSDLVTVVKNMGLGVNGRGTVAPYQVKQVKGPEKIFSKFFIRLHVQDEAGVLAGITQCFAEHDISLERVLQVPRVKGKDSEIMLVTHTASRYQMEQTRHALEGMNAVYRIKSCYRVEGGA